MKRPKIILTCPEKEEKSNISLFCNHYYIKAVKESGGIPILTDPSYEGLEDELLELADGLILTGGGDIEPSLYHEKKDPKTKDIDIKRDNFEISLLKKAVEMEIPVLGICRGIQIINVAYKGTLYQDLPGHTYNKNHIINIKKNSILDKIFKKDKIEVNSYHHQGVKDIAPGFEAIAKSNEGIIEAIILDDNKKFIFGVQWHPERMYESFKDLFLEFIKIAEERRRS